MKKIFAFLISAIALTGCSPYALVNSEVYNNADLASYKTFRIITPDEGKLPPGMQMVTYYNIAAAVREQMVDRGFTEDPNSPLLINLAVSVQKEIQTEPVLPPNYTPYPAPYPIPPRGPYYYPFYMYPRQYYWPNYAAYYRNAQVITGIYREGVLTMDMVNIQEKLPLYSASVATIIQNGGSGYRNLEGIAEAVETLFSRFPVPLLPQYK